MTMSEARKERVAKLQLKLAEIEARKKALTNQIRNLNKPTKKERDARTHRLCQIGGLVEKYAGREITNLADFEAWIATQTNYIKG